MNEHRHTSPPPSGFTLIELLVVVVILSIVAGITSMAAAEGGEQHLDLAEVQLRDAMTRAEALARSSRSPHAVVFDVAGNRFAVVDEDGNAVVDPLTKRGYVVDFVRPGQPTLVRIAAVNFSDAGNAAIYDAQGVPLTNGAINLQAGNSACVLLWDGATGDLRRQ